MTQSNTYMGPLNSPINKPKGTTKAFGRPTLPGLSPRNGSLPDALNFRIPIPANVINIVPKSGRGDTLKIFKSKEKEDKELGMQGDEPLVKKGDAHLDAIRKNDTTWTVESLVEKGRKEYEKKHKQKMKGSMYVNDLWGKQYEGEIKRQTRIDAELKNTEHQKRKPLQLKLDHVVGYFQHKGFNSVRGGKESLKVLSPDRSSNLQLVTEPEFYYSTTVSALQTERPMYTEEVTGNQPTSRTELNGGMSPKNLLLPSIKAIHNKHASIIEKQGAYSARIHKETILLEYEKKNGLEQSELKVSRLNLKGLSDKSPGDVLMKSHVHHQSLKPRRVKKQKSFFMKTKGALNNLLNLCQTDMNSNKEMIHTIKGVKEVWLQGEIEKQKMYNQMKKDELILSMNKRHQIKGSM